MSKKTHKKTTNIYVYVYVIITKGIIKIKMDIRRIRLRAVHAGSVSVVVVEPQEYTRPVTLTRRSALLRDFYPLVSGTAANGRSRSRGRNERTGLARGQGPAWPKRPRAREATSGGW